MGENDYAIKTDQKSVAGISAESDHEMNQKPIQNEDETKKPESVSEEKPVPVMEDMQKRNLCH